MWDFIKWYFISELLGWIVFPIAFSLFPFLRDRGFSVSKILGLLIWGYLYWLLNTLGLLDNSASAVILVLGAIIIGIVLLFRNKFKPIIIFIKGHWEIIVFYELIFIISFAGWAFIRALNPEIIGTEKPMELAFINSIYRSPIFPPADPWLSGYAISYYYFGYLLVAMLMHFCGTVSGVAFNLAIALWFSMICVASSGLLFNMLPNRSNDSAQVPRRYFGSLFLSLLAPLAILIIGNAEGFLELLHARGILWNMSVEGGAASSFWRWLDIQELSASPSHPLAWRPFRVGGAWWWRASRVLQDYDVLGNPRDIIDEFPFFSFYLADFHPHVVSIPFVLLVLFKALSLLKTKGLDQYKRISLRSAEVWITAFLCGSLIFINTWDFPIYAGLFIITYYVKGVLCKGDPALRIKETIFYGLSIGMASIILFLPFVLGLSSQAGGFLPSLVFRTRGIHFFVMFFFQIIFVTWFLAGVIRKNGALRLVKYFLLVVVVCIFLFSLSILYVFFYARIPGLIQGFGESLNVNTSQWSASWLGNLQVILSIYGGQNASTLISQSIQRLFSQPTVILLMSAWIAASMAVISSIKNQNEEQRVKPIGLNSRIFSMVMIIMGALLCLMPEFFYLRDQFGWRMNTIFKFYYQAWILLSLVAAYFAASSFINVKKGARKIVFTSLAVIIFGITLVYPYFALAERINYRNQRANTLDGNAFLRDFNPDEYEAIQFLARAPYGVVSEAVGGSYTHYGRISRLTGLPTVLGWPGHELQWRGGTAEIGTREQDIAVLYSTADWQQAQRIISQYQIDYIYVGQLERSSYKVVEEKFMANMALVYENMGVRIYSERSAP